MYELPISYSWPLWVAFGSVLSILGMVVVGVLCVYRSLLWLRFRMKLGPVYESLAWRQSMNQYDPQDASREQDGSAEEQPYHPPPSARLTR